MNTCLFRTHNLVSRRFCVDRFHCIDFKTMKVILRLNFSIVIQENVHKNYQHKIIFKTKTIFKFLYYVQTITKHV